MMLAVLLGYKVYQLAYPTAKTNKTHPHSIVMSINRATTKNWLLCLSVLQLKIFQVCKIYLTNLVQIVLFAFLN